jgi:tRNA A-37 threonylcarbamoyl transferase component Bud32
LSEDAEPFFSPKSVPDARVGTVLEGHYRIERRIGRGGMGTVYEATNLAIKKRVAIKFLHAEIAEDAGAVARFRREAIAASALEHPNIVSVLDMDQASDGSVFLVLEYLDGREWADDLEDDPRPPVARTLHIVSQIAGALGAAHAKEIVHRDLKPENVLLLARGDDRDFVKVLDFGVAKMAGVTGAPSTRTGTAVGTPYYMAPEQLRDSSSVDARADVWALGVMLYRALAGRLPFEGTTLPEIAMKIVSDDPEPLASLRPDAPPELAALVMRMLAKDAAERPADAGRVHAALRAIAGGSSPDVALADTMRAAGVVEIAPSRVQTPAPHAPARRAAVIAAAALGIASIALLGWLAWPRDEAVPDPIPAPARPAPEVRAPEPASVPAPAPELAPTAPLEAPSPSAPSHEARPARTQPRPATEQPAAEPPAAEPTRPEPPAPPPPDTDLARDFLGPPS